MSAEPPRWVSLILYANAFFVGAVMLSLEIVASRYLYPYYGGSVGTWAGLISIVLLALTAGYLVGGRLADAYPTPRLIAVAVATAALFLAWLPALAVPVIEGIQFRLGDGPAGILATSTVLLFIPCGLMGTLPPAVLRLLIRSPDTSGRVSGRVYGVSTIGNVAGILVTTFVLMPGLGSRTITYLFALALAASAISLFLLPWRREPVGSTEAIGD